MPATDRKLRVFLCHASQDKPVVRELYQRLLDEGWIDPWLDEEKLLPGQDWDMEIEKAVESADAVIVCLSNKSVTKEGYIQRELKFALDIALEKPEGTIFIVPLRLDDCMPSRRLRSWQYADYFPDAQRDLSYIRLIKSFKWRLDNSSFKAETDLANDEISVQKSASLVKLLSEKDSPLLINRKGKKFFRGSKVRISNRLAGTIKPEETGHTVEIHASVGHTGVVLELFERDVLMIKWDEQEWREFFLGSTVKLKEFHATIHIDYLDLVSD